MVYFTLVKKKKTQMKTMTYKKKHINYETLTNVKN